MAAHRHIGILGGTFDPVHHAHLALGRSALATLELDELRWVPTRQPWYKNAAPTPAAHREAMLQLALASADGDPRFVLDRTELASDGPGYTLDTVRALQSAHPHARWTLVLGQDQYAALHTWHGWQTLLDLLTLAVAHRPGHWAAPAAAVAACPHRVLPLPMLEISATDVRQRVRAGRDISQLVPPQVARYIELHRLYQATE